MQRSIATAVAFLFLCTSAQAAPRDDRRAELSRITDEIAAAGYTPEGKERDLIARVEKELDRRSPDLDYVDDALRRLDRGWRARVGEREADAAARRAQHKQAMALRTKNGDPLVEILLLGGIPEKGQKVSLGGTEVYQKVDDGYLITVARAYPAVSSGRTMFLRSEADYVNGQALRGSAAYEGKSYTYDSALGTRETVLELRALVQEN